MSRLSPALSPRRESPTLVVVTTALQLGLVVLGWLLALAPAALAALSLMTFKAIRRTFAPPIGHPIGDDEA